MNLLTTALVAIVIFPAIAMAEQRPPVTPTAKDKCPVCGMISAAYPDFLSQIIFSDGSYVTFDGPKDMFRYLLGRQPPAPVEVIYVKDYYSLNYIDARRAFFVIGSDVYGPMGREFIPFANKQDAEVFKKDHRGRDVLAFDEITAETLKHKDSKP